MRSDCLYLLMPCYNEEANIETVINHWYSVCKELEEKGTRCHIVVANDGSKDGTLKKLNSLTEQIPILEVIDKANSGHGATINFLYRYALESHADYVFQTDSDGQTVPEDFFPLWDKREEYDFLIGDRCKRQDGVGRIIVTKVLRAVLYISFGVWVKDANSPFRLMKARALREVLDVIPNDFALTNAAISAVSVKIKKYICWKPITFKPRQGGKNSINFRRIICIGINALSGFRQINRSLK